MRKEILREKLKNASLPIRVHETIEAELSRLSTASPASNEYSIVCSYISWILALPWAKCVDRTVDLAEARLILEEKVIGLEKAKNRLLEIFSSAAADSETCIPSICLTGSSGTGKRTLVTAMAEALGREFIELNCNALLSEDDLKGEWRREIGNRPGALIRALAECETSDPVILIDSTRLFGDGSHSRIIAPLISLVSSTKRRSFYDRYINIEFDLSRAMLFITTHAAHHLPPEIPESCEIISFPGYMNKTKEEIARRFIIPKKLHGTGLALTSRSFSDEILRAVIEGYTFESGVHQLDRVLGRFCSKLVREKLELGVRRFSLARDDVPALLGPPTIRPEIVGRHPEVGIASALIYGTTGGSVLFVEANRMAGIGRVRVTGAEHSSLHELVEQAISFMLSHIDDLELSREKVDTSDVHVHFPPGIAAVDARSLGLATITALVSLFSEMPVHQRYAFCGELTLRGKILPVEYVEEKVLAAHRAGIDRIYLSSLNRRDVSFLPREVAEDVEFMFVDTVSEALEDSLLKIIVPNRNLDPSLDVLAGNNKADAQ